MALLSRCSPSGDLVGGVRRLQVLKVGGGEGGRAGQGSGGGEAMSLGEFWQKAFELKKSE